jgi:hypothetical protein
MTRALALGWEGQRESAIFRNGYDARLESRAPPEWKSGAPTRGSRYTLNVKCFSGFQLPDYPITQSAFL